MMTYAAAYLATLVTFVALDMAWLSVMGPRLYKPTLGDILLPDIVLAPAIAFYLIYPVGLVIFAVVPALRSGALSSALAYGALFGFFTYATYDLTNQVTLRNWTLQLTLTDCAWGCVLAALAATASFWITGKLGFAG